MTAAPTKTTRSRPTSRSAATWLVAVLVAAMLAGCSANEPPTDEPPEDPVEVVDRLAFEDAWEAREFDVVSDPRDPDRLTMGFMIPRPDPRLFWLGIARSDDGGGNWTLAHFCGDPEEQADGVDVVDCPFAGAAALGDPALEVLHDGTVVYVGVMVDGYDVAQFAARFRPGEMEPESVTIIARSAFDQVDGAHMLPAPLRVYYNGKANVMQEPDTDRIHAVWAVDLRFEETGLPNTALPVWTHSDDGGRSWSQPERISGHGFGDIDAPFAVGADIIKSHDGRLHVTWWDGKTNTLQQVTSPDAGDRWHGPRDIADAQGRPEGGPVDFYNVTRPWLEIAPSGPDAGDLVIVYDHIGDGDRDVMLVRSQDDGLTWSEPVLVSHLGARDRQDETLPRAVFEPSGTLSVLYVTYDGQWRTSGHRMHLARSVDGGSTFDHVEVSSGGSPLQNVGDYNALAVTRDDLVMVWEDGRGGPSGSHRAWQASVPLA